jgi:hypothetical protein
MIFRRHVAYIGLDKTRIPLGMPSVTTLPIANLPPDAIKVRVRWRWQDAGKVFIKTRGQIACHILLIEDEKLWLFDTPESVNQIVDQSAIRNPQSAIE